MAHYGTLRDFAFRNDTDMDDIRGSALYGVNDEKLGKIDDVIFDHATGEVRYVVVDTGGWLRSKKFLVPADRVHDYAKDKDAFQVDLVKEHIEKFPPYDEDRMKSDADWRNYEDSYKRGWDEAPVQHQEGRLDLNVTPADVSGTQPHEVRAQRDVNVPMGSLGEEVSDIRNTRRDRSAQQQDIEGRNLTPERIAGKFPESAQGSHKIDMAPSAYVGEREPRSVESTRTAGDQQSRFDQSQNINRDPYERSNVRPADVGQWHPQMRRFEDVLRKNRVDVTASCPSCAAAKKDDAA
ncbi:MAG TPA: PRC-barrel domain-containing protein [Terriglobales bacterium]|nr:PRC-barrel domain-containing protein [Terriglobales bacterium]